MGESEVVVLDAVVSLFEESPYNNVQAKAIQERSGLDDVDVGRAMTALAGAGFFDGTRVNEIDSPIRISSVSERARRTVGQWPNPEALVDRLVMALSAAAEEASDPVERTKLNRRPRHCAEQAGRWPSRGQRAHGRTRTDAVRPKVRPWTKRPNRYSTQVRRLGTVPVGTSSADFGGALPTCACANQGTPIQRVVVLTLFTRTLRVVDPCARTPSRQDLSAD
jgi:hypothetical protein